jgi:hypothetical protein
VELCKKFRSCFTGTQLLEQVTIYSLFHFSTGHFSYIKTLRHLHFSGFILWAIFLCFAVRILGTIGQTFLVNWLRKGINPINWQVRAPT